MNPWVYKILTEVSYEYIRKVASGTMNNDLLNFLGIKNLVKKRKN